MAKPGLGRRREEIQGSSLQGDWWSRSYVGFTLFSSFNYLPVDLPRSVWADGSLAGLSGQYGKKMELPNQSQPNQSHQSHHEDKIPPISENNSVAHFSNDALLALPPLRDPPHFHFPRNFFKLSEAQCFPFASKKKVGQLEMAKIVERGGGRGWEAKGHMPHVRGMELR